MQNTNLMLPKLKHIREVNTAAYAFAFCLPIKADRWGRAFQGKKTKKTRTSCNKDVFSMLDYCKKLYPSKDNSLTIHSCYANNLTKYRLHCLKYPKQIMNCCEKIITTSA